MKTEHEEALLGRLAMLQTSVALLYATMAARSDRPSELLLGLKQRVRSGMAQGAIAVPEHLDPERVRAAGLDAAEEMFFGLLPEAKN